MKGEFAESQFESDVRRQQEIVRRRKSIDSEIKQVESQLEQLSESLETKKVDTVAVAEIQAELDNLWDQYNHHIRGLRPELVLAELQTLLLEERSRLGTQHHDLKNALPSTYDRAAYEEHRSSLDAEYAVRLQKDKWEKEKLGKQRAKDAAMGGSSTSAVAATMKKPKSKGYSPSEGWISSNR